MAFIDFNKNGIMDPYEDPSRPIPERVEDLLARMTLEEKVAQLLHPWTKGDDVLKETYGSTGLGALYIFWVQDRNDVQRHIIEHSRLGIPVSFVQEALHSGAKGGTIFPMPCGMASSWNPELVRQAHEVIARDARAVGVNITLSPNIDVHTDPRFGRIEEGWGEDPRLTAAMGVAAVRGLQGDGETIDQDHIAATAKHFTAYGRTENGQDGSAADLSERTLREVYLRPFEAVVKEANARAIMPAHNEINGVPCHGNRALLTGILREEWGFDGLVYSDYSDVKGLAGYHVAASLQEAGVMALTAGVDLELGAHAFPELVNAVKEGKIAESAVDAAVRRVLEMKFRTGLFEHPYVEEARRDNLDSPEHRALALEMARQSIVLLKNDGLLPLKDMRSIAVIGPNADNAKNQLGGYTQHGAHVVTVLEGIRNAVGPQVTVTHAQGCNIMDDSAGDIPAAVALAQDADVAVVVVGDSKESCQESYGGVTGDRTSLDLSGGQLELIKAVHATGTPVVVVLINGRPQSIGWVVEHVPAIVEAWRPGEEGGTAIADVLFGKVNPSGKLAVTFPRSVGQVPAYYFRKVRQYNGRKYTFEDSSPLFPFGFGQSYTTFDYANLTITPAEIPMDGAVTVAVEVTNTGDRAGDEVVQLYVHDVLASVTRPIKEMIDFRRVTLQPGETRRVEFTLQPSQLAFYDIDMRYVTEPGAFQVMVGPNSAEGLEDSFTVGGVAQPVDMRHFAHEGFVPTPEVPEA